MPIPKILHQLWIGPLPMPKRLMDTWSNKHPDWEIIRWTEKEIEKRGIQFKCQHRIDEMPEWNGKADIMRWEILHEFGGVFVDADSHCLEPLDKDIFLKGGAFAGYENEEVRPGLVATGTMGFPPHHPLCRDAVQWILDNDVSPERTNKKAWQLVGPLLLTHLLEKESPEKYEFMVYPSYTFLPIHHTGIIYHGHGKVYAFQEWASTKQSYVELSAHEVPHFLLPQSPPPFWVSVLITSFNTPEEFLRDCLASLREQIGYFGIELVWIDDGSSPSFRQVLKRMLNAFLKTTRFVNLEYEEMTVNQGVGVVTALQRGLHSGCTKEIVVRMDSDFIMIPSRIQTQLDFMYHNPDCVLCGCQVVCLRQEEGTPNTWRKKETQKTNYPLSLTWGEYQTHPTSWFMNHSTLCFKRSAIIGIGGYNTEKNVKEKGKGKEDFDLEERVLQKYGKIYNLPESLVIQKRT